MESDITQVNMSEVTIIQLENYVNNKVNNLFNEIVEDFDLPSGDVNFEMEMSIDKFKATLFNYVIGNLGHRIK